MGKIAQVSVKYIIHATLKAEGLVDKPDIIGAIFGQTEGLLGKEMELRELQKNGRIGRIEVDTSDKDGKTTARIKIPTSIDKTQTAIIAAAIETIERIGPTNGVITLDKIEDVRIEKRDYIQERAKEILSRFIKESDNSAVSAKDVSEGVRKADVISYGPEGLSAGPEVESSDDIIIVEGRADVLALLRAGINNAVSANGTNVPSSIIELMKRKKVITAFVDGDRGGDLIIKGLRQVGRVDFIAKAPDGKEVEELTDKEINQCLRAKIPVIENTESIKPVIRQSRIKDSDFYNKELDELSGKNLIRIYNNSMEMIGEIPVAGIRSIRGLSDVNAIIADAPINDELLYFAQDNGAEILVGTKVETRKRTRIKILTKRTL